MQTINFTISNMKSPHCQMTVTNIVKSLGGNVIKIEPTKAEVELTPGLSKDAMISAIQKAGYNVS